MGDTLHPLRSRSAVKFICTDGKERIGTTEKRMNTANQKEKNLLAESVEKGELSHLFASYIDYCADNEKIPNLAGFCRYFGGSMSDIASLRESRPSLYGEICAALEDEAINSKMSSSVLSVYLKQRLGYVGERPPERDDEGACVRLVFEHDPYADGE